MLHRWLLSLSLPLYALDQATKLWILRRFPPPEAGLDERISVIPGFFWFHRVHNTGIAWGNFNGGAYSNLIFGSVSIAALTAVSVLWRRGGFPTRLGKTAAALLMTGIIGNLTDRIAHGYVVDFLLFNLGGAYARVMGTEYFPSFNVADSCICIAAWFLMISAWQKSAEPAPSTA